MKRLAAISTMLLALLVAPSLVKANPEEGQPHMQAALDHLQKAKEELQGMRQTNACLSALFR